MDCHKNGSMWWFNLIWDRHNSVWSSATSIWLRNVWFRQEPLAEDIIEIRPSLNIQKTRQIPKVQLAGMPIIFYNWPLFWWATIRPEKTGKSQCLFYFFLPYAIILPVTVYLQVENMLKNTQKPVKHSLFLQFKFASMFFLSDEPRKPLSGFVTRKI